MKDCDIYGKFIKNYFSIGHLIRNVQEWDLNVEQISRDDLLFGFPTFSQGWRVLSNVLLTPQLPSHLEVGQQHDDQRQAVGEDKVQQVVAEAGKYVGE